ncbi:MAG: membrane protein insertase YidC [Castellaniella sp.]
MDIRRTLLWMIFSFSLLLLWNNWQTHQGKPSMFAGTGQSQTREEAPATTAGTGSGDASVPSTPAVAAAPAAGAPGDVAQVPGVAGDDRPASEIITADTQRFSLGFDTLGAQLIKVELHDYTAPGTPDEPMVLLDRNAHYTYVAQSGVVGAPAGRNWPTHLSPFELVANGRSADGKTRNIVFQAESDGLRVTKTFAVNDEEYIVRVSHALTNLGDEPVSPAIYLQLTRDDSDPGEASTFYRTFTGPALYSEQDKYQKVKFSDVDKGKARYTQQADNGWIGMVQHYFASAWVPGQGEQRTNEVLRLDEHLYAIRAIQHLGAIAAGDSLTTEARLWVGPQDQKAMSALAPGLELVVDYGWLTIIAKPVFKLMTWIHSMIGNWGWTIVVLTLLIKAVFYPLSAASYRSMAKMKLVGPRLKNLREQYGDDRAKLNAAMMEMYRTEKINPLGGCLPMLVQIPVFIALYWVLLGSVEMRGAPWVGWITDLSVRDPWFILPAFMMATMFLQIKLNPTPPDPMQARIMMVMPLVFGGMMFFFPAGLVLYWCVNNAISIIQQRYIMHRIDKEAAAAKA